MDLTTTESAYAHLMEHGFVVIPQALHSTYCERALAAIHSFKQKHHTAVKPNADEYGHLYRVVNTHLAIDELTDAFVHSTPALAVADRYFGRPATLYTSLYYERGSEQSFHRDTPYFCTKPADQYLGMWLALDDVDANNGPLCVVPGSHRLPPVDVEALARELFPDNAEIPKISDKAFARYQAEVQQQSDAHGLVAQQVHVNQGDVIIWHPSMLHGGAPHLNKERSRRSLVMHITPQGMPVYQTDVFFQPSKPVSEHASWRYYKHHDRKIAKFNQIDFGHQYVMPVRRLRWLF